MAAAAEPPAKAGRPAEKSPTSVGESLWWEPFESLLAELERADPASSPASSLVDKLDRHGAWLLKSVTMFKSPNQASRSALEGQVIGLGARRIEVRLELKELAMELSRIALLDEVQSYIVVSRYVERNNMPLEFKVENLRHRVLLHYYLERQCLLKCIRQIIVHSYGFDSSSKISKMVKKLFSDGLEKVLLCIIMEDLFACNHFEYADADFTTLSVEESLIETNLVLDILFLAYYDTISTCKYEQWKSLCSIFKGILSNSLRIGKLSVSGEAENFLRQAKTQLLLILIETLNLDNLLHIVHDGLPFRQDEYAFSVVDIQEIDANLASFNISETPEVGVLFLAWGVFHCLLSSLPDKHDNSILVEIDHVAYVSQAFEVSPLTYLREILDRNVLGDSVCSHLGYKSVMKTLISAFIAAYEISNQHENSTSDQLLDVLCKIYRGEESLCVQFWDKESFVDSPIRCFLSSLEGEFPFRSVGFVCFLSALCEGAWAAECVYNFLDRMCGLTSLFKIPGLSSAEDCPKIIETSRPYAFPGFDVLIIPSQTRGQVLKIMDGNTVLVRWQHKQSGIYILLLTLVWDLHQSHYEEVSVILDLLHRLMSMNMALCFALLNSNYSADAMPSFVQNIPCFDFASIVCFVISNVAVGDSNVGLMSTCFSILSKLLQCSPLYIAEVAQRTNILDLGAGVTSSGVWMPPGRLAKFLMIDCEQTEDCCSLTLSVLSFIGQLVEAGVEDDLTHSLAFALQYVFIDHEHWKFKVRHARWKVTLKVLELMKTCIDVIQDSKRLGLFVRDVLLFDSSIHDALFRIMCVTAPSLEEFYVSRQFEWKEIEGVQLAIVSVLDIIYSMLSNLNGSNSLLFSEDYTTGFSAFHQALVLASNKPMPILKAVMSLISFARNPDIQIGAARVLSMLCSISENIFLITDEAQIAELRSSIHKILCDDTISNEDLLIAVFQMLTSAAIYQPFFLLAIFSVDSASTCEMKQLRLESTSDSSKTTDNSILNLLMERVRMSNALIQSSPLLLLNILFLLRALWRGSSQYACILKSFKASRNFWENMLLIVEKGSNKSGSFQKLKGNWNICLAYEYQCQAAVLDMVAHEFFLHKKMLKEKKTEALTKPLSETNIVNNSDVVKGSSNSFLEMDVQLSSWIGDSGIEELTKLYTYFEYDKAVFDHLKTSICMFIVKLMLKLSEGDVGCMSVSLVEDVREAIKKLNEQPAFAELLLQYSFRGYSKGNESALVLTDLYYHLQGELEGRVIAPGSFKDLSSFLLCLDIFKKNDHKSIMEFLPPDGTSYLFDSKYVRRRINLKFWEYSKFETSKEAIGNMLMHISNANNMVFCMDSKQSALKALNSVLSVSLVSMGPDSPGQVMKEKVAKSCINLLLKSLPAASELLITPLDLLDNVLNYLSAQAELLLIFSSYLSSCDSSQPSKHQYVPIFVDVIKASGSVIRVLDDVKPCIPKLKETIKFLLSLLLTSFDYCLKSDMQTKSELVGANALSDISFASLGILPTLCCLAEAVEYCNIAISTMDVILKDFLTSSTWLPVLQKHLNLQNTISKLQDKNPLISVFVLLKFFLTLARTHGGAELLHSANILSSLKYLFAQPLAEKPSTALRPLEGGLISMTGSDGKAECIWGLGLAIVIAMIDSLADFPSLADVVENVIMFFFVEKSDLISYYLSAPELPADNQSKKRARTKNASTSLHALMETKSTLELICTLAKHQIVWNKTMKGRDSALREQIIHLLAFISKGGQRIGESPSKTPSIMWLSVSKEQLDSYGGLQLMGSKHGWFALCALDGKHTSLSPGAGTALFDANQIREPIQASSKIHFSDSAALLMYKIAYFLITFLCSQAEAAAKRAEDVGFIDLAHYPELPMPEILHGLQDQCMTIVTEVCLFNEEKVVLAESQAVCLFLLQIVEKALYLELCVCQICGIRPVLGRVEDFSKRIKSLFKAAEQHTFLATPLKTLRPIFPHLYPGLLPNEAPST